MHGLVVESDSNCQDQLVHALEAMRIRVHVAGSSAAALELLTGNRFDLTVLDVDMPGLVSGFELARRITSRIGTILIGERRFEEEFNGDDWAYPFYYLRKPIDDRLLLSCLRMFSEQERLRREVTRLRREIRLLRAAHGPGDGNVHEVDDLWFGLFNRLRRDDDRL